MTLLTKSAAVEFADGVARKLWPQVKWTYLGDRDDLAHTAVVAVLEWAATLDDPDKLDEGRLLKLVNTTLAAAVKGFKRTADVAVGDNLAAAGGDHDDSTAVGSTLRRAIDSALRGVGYDDRDLELVWLGLGMGWTAEAVAEDVNSRREYRKLPRLTPEAVAAKLTAATATLRRTGPPELEKAWATLRRRAVSRGWQ